MRTTSTRRRRLPSPALVVAIIALVAALAGTAVAEEASISAKPVTKKKVKKIANTQIDKRFPIGTDQIADGAVNSSKVEDGSLNAADVAAGQFFRNVVVRETVVANVGNNGFQVEVITCQPGEKALAGGGGFTPLGSRNYSVTEIGSSTRLISPVNAAGDALADGQAPAGFLVSLQNVSGAARDYHGYVVCAQL